jgi:UrcA family protein
MQKLMFAAAAALCALAAAPAAAQGRAPGGLGKVQVVQGVVRYATTELASPAAADRLFLRIRQRATQLCLPVGLPRVQVGLGAETRACRDRAVARAVHDLAAPLVTAAYERRTAREVASR